MVRLKLLVAELRSVLHGLFGKRKKQYKRRHFLKVRVYTYTQSGEESEKTLLALSCLRCSYSIAGLWVSFSFPWVARLQAKAELEHMNGF